MGVVGRGRGPAGQLDARSPTPGPPCEQRPRAHARRQPDPPDHRDRRRRPARSGGCCSGSTRSRRTTSCSASSRSRPERRPGATPATRRCRRFTGVAHRRRADYVPLGLQRRSTMIVSRILRRALLATALLATATSGALAGDGPDTPAPGAALRPAVPASVDPKVTFEKYTLANGLEVHPRPRQDRAARRGQRLVPRRLGQRGLRQERVRAPVRAHAVPGLEARRRRQALRDPQEDRRRRASTARPTPIARTTTRSCRRTSSRPRCGSRAIGWATCSSRAASTGNGQPRQPDRGRAQRAPAALRQRRRTARRGSRVSAALYPEGHPYRYLTIGKHEDLDRPRRSTT